MKVEDLAKWQKLLINMYNDGPIAVADDFESLHEMGLAASEASLRSMLSDLKKRGYVENSEDATWYLTDAGLDYIDELDAQLDQTDETDEVDEHVRTANEYAELAKKYAADAVNAAAKLQQEQSKVDELIAENKKLQAENATLAKQYESLRNTFKSQPNYYEDVIKQLKQRNTELAAKLDQKTRQCEHLEDSLSKVANSLGEFQSWIANMKNGRN